MNERYSPISRLPLRNPGEFLLQKRTSIVVEDILLWLFVIFFIGFFTIFEWIRWFSNIPPDPFPITVLFIIGVVITTVHFLRVMSKLRNYDLGLIGERMLAEVLDKGLRAQGYFLIHDVPFDKMNVDHILVGPGGVFTIETKAARKYTGKKNVISHTSKGLCINERSGRCGKALREAEKEAAFVQKLLSESNCQCPKVQPIIVYIGWWVEDDCSRPVWVLNEKYLVGKIPLLKSVLSKGQIDSIRSKIEEYARKEGRKDYV